MDAGADEIRRDVPSRGLVVRDPWIGLILSGTKTWELRSRATRFRGRFGLIRSGSGLVLGEAKLVDVLGPFSGGDLAASDERHRAAAYVARNADRFPTLYAWVLEGALAWNEPVAYSHPRGAVVWVDLDASVRA